MEFDEKLMKRIWSAINKTDTCWLSKYAKTPDGYTVIWINGENQKFHRVMLFWSDQTKITEFNSSINIKACEWKACHTCLNKHCVNPAHLYWGTALDNMRDRIKDGTTNNGEKCGTSKLTQIQVDEIRAKYKPMTYKSLAIEYSKSYSEICNIMRGRGNDAIAIEIREKYNNQYGYEKLSAEYKITKSTIKKIILKTTWK